MCGITGIVDLRSARDIPEALIRAMNDSQAHRGPDGDGLFIEPGLAFGHRRLAIIDLATGDQPMVSSCGNIVVVFNGEIYNYREVRTELEDYGYSFRTASDTEVILAAWLEWGERCVNRLRGMFAIALWDKRTRSLFLARDRFGVKPLHMAMTPDGFLLFGSELKSVITHPGVRREFDVRAVEDFFAYGYVAEPRTIFTSVRKLPAGHLLTLRRGQPVPMSREYWDIDFTTVNRASERELEAELVERMREAVALRMIADVPLGAFLSGGVDSSAVVALMSEVSVDPVNTCSIGFAQDDFNELDYAGIIAARYGTRHRTRIVDAADFSAMDVLVASYDEPFADPSALPTYAVSALARETVTVALSGDGGDELLAGYRRQRMHMNEEKIRSRIPAPLRRGLFGMLGAAYPKLDWAPRVLRAKSTLQSLGKTTADAYFHSVSIMGDDIRKRLFTDRFRADLQGYRAAELMREIIDRAPAHDELSKIQYADLKIWLPGDILTKVDRASMAVGLESREPLLDHELAEFCAQLPPGLRLRGGQGKYLMKKAFESRVPHDLLYRPKMGFSVPLADWFRGPLKEPARQAAASPRILDTGWFQPAQLAGMVEQHIRGVEDNSRFIWQLLMFDKSLAHLDQVGVAAVQA